MSAGPRGTTLRFGTDAEGKGKRPTRSRKVKASCSQGTPNFMGSLGEVNGHALFVAVLLSRWSRQKEGTQLICESI